MTTMCHDYDKGVYHHHDIDVDYDDYYDDDYY